MLFCRCVLKGDFPSDIFHAATSQMYNFPSGNFTKVRLGLLRSRRLQGGGASAKARMGFRLRAVARTG